MKEGRKMEKGRKEMKKKEEGKKEELHKERIEGRNKSKRRKPSSGKPRIIRSSGTNSFKRKGRSRKCFKTHISSTAKG